MGRWSAGTILGTEHTGEQCSTLDLLAAGLLEPARDFARRILGGILYVGEIQHRMSKGTTELKFPKMYHG